MLAVRPAALASDEPCALLETATQGNAPFSCDVKRERQSRSSAEPDQHDLQQQQAEKHSNDEHDEITNERTNVHDRVMRCEGSECAAFPPLAYLQWIAPVVL